MMDPNFTSLYQLLEYRAQNQPDQTAYIYLKDGRSEEKISYRELHNKAITIANHIRKNTSFGDRVLINHHPGLEYIAAFFGCIYAGVTAVPVYPPKFNAKLDRLKSIVENSGAAIALTSSSIMENISELITSDHLLKEVKWLLSNNLPDAFVSQYTQPDITENIPVFIQYTSGSTSSPKGVVLSNKNLLSNLEAMRISFDVNQDSVGGFWLPPYHDMGLVSGLLTPIYTGFFVVLISPFTFLQRPLKWLQMITNYKVTFSGAPNFAFDLCVNRIKDSQLAELDLSSWDTAFTGAEPIQKETLLRFSEKFKACGFNQKSICPCYGLAECTLKATGAIKGNGYRSICVDVDELELKGQANESDAGRTYISCGKSVLGIQIKIVHPETFEELGEGFVGEIWISGPSVSEGYWHREEITREIFGRCLKGASDSSFMRTGDLGFLKDGELYITGRQKDLIIYNGRNIYPQDIEKTVQSLNPGLKIGGGAAFGLENSQGSENVVVVQEVDRKAVVDFNYDEVAAQIMEAVLETHEIPTLGVSFIKMNTIPLTSSGKIQRHACKRLFLSNGLVELKRILTVG